MYGGVYSFTIASFSSLCRHRFVFSERIRGPPSSTRTDTPFPYRPLFRSALASGRADGRSQRLSYGLAIDACLNRCRVCSGRRQPEGPAAGHARQYVTGQAAFFEHDLATVIEECEIGDLRMAVEIGRAHV